MKRRARSRTLMLAARTHLFASIAPLRSFSSITRSRIARWSAVSSIALGLASVAGPARAEPRHRVVVLSTASEALDPVRAELEARLRGELTAAGMEVVVVPAPEADDVRDAVETSARDLLPSAVIGVREPPVMSTEHSGLEVWISDRLSGRTLVQRARTQESRRNQVALLAIQVAELFKARLGLSWIEPVQPAPEEPPPAAPAAPPPAPPLTQPEPPRSARLLFGAGVGVVHQLGDSISEWFPSLQFGFEPVTSSWAVLALRANAGFTPSRSEVDHPTARARVTQTWGFAQGYARFVPKSPIQPTVSLGGGVYSVDVKGESDQPGETRNVRTWSAAATLGVGLWLQANDAFAFAVEAQGLSTWSKTIVRLRGDEAATFGFPAAFISANWIGRY